MFIISGSSVWSSFVCMSSVVFMTVVIVSVGSFGVCGVGGGLWLLGRCLIGVVNFTLKH